MFLRGRLSQSWALASELPCNLFIYQGTGHRFRLFPGAVIKTPDDCLEENRNCERQGDTCVSGDSALASPCPLGPHLLSEYFTLIRMNFYVEGTDPFCVDNP